MKKLIKHTFVPHHENNYHPHLFRKGVISVFLAIAFLVLAGGALHKLVLHTSQNLAAVYAKVLVALTNDKRGEEKLGVLRTNTLLEEAAQMKANDMAEKGYFAHYGPDGSAPWNWIDKAGYTYDVAGENLAIDFTDSEDVTEAWMNSPAHRANILNNKFTEIGIATAEGKYQGHSTTFVVQMFGTPKEKKISFINTNVVTGIAEASFSTSSDATSTTIVFSKSTTTTIKQAATSSVLGADITGNDLSIKEYVATNPSKIARIIYGVLFTLVFIGLLCLLFIEYGRQDPKHRLHAILILLVLFVCAYVYQHYVVKEVKISYEIHNSIVL